MRRATILAVTTVVCFAADAHAEDLRIESRIYVGEEASPAYRNLTLFQRHVVYDFIDGPAGETTIYESHTGTFTLLDAERKVKTTLDRETLAEFVARIEVRAGKTEKGSLIPRSRRAQIRSHLRRAPAKA